jgi:serine/threonine-protein kinase
MDLRGGTTVQAVLDDGRRYSTKEAVDHLQGVLRGLDYMHAQNLIHRDIKPGNLIF